MNSPTVLIYHMEKPRAQIVSAVCQGLGIRPVKVEAADHRTKTGVLTGSLEGEASVGPASLGPAGYAPVDEEMIVMAHFSRELFETLTDALKMAGVRISLRAVQTETNRTWSGEMLQAELKREREAFRKIEAARNSV